MNVLLTLLCLTFLVIPLVAASHESEDTSDQHLRCYQIIANEWCTGGYYQAEANLYASCDMSRAMSIQQGCRRNSNNDYCAASNAADIDAISSACQTSRARECTEDCRGRLMQIRNDLGCCINVELNDTTNDRSQDPFNHALWVNCGVEPIIEECTPSIISAHRVHETSESNLNCNMDYLLSENTELVCTRSFVEGIQRALRDGGNCEPYIQLFSVSCTVSESGERCISRQNNNSQLFLQALDACLRDASDGNCSEECRQALVSFGNVAGCCVNSFVTRLQLSVTINGGTLDTIFNFESCGLEPPGICEVGLNEASGVVQVTSLALANALLLLTWLLIE